VTEWTSQLGLPGAVDPAYAHELDVLAARCRDFLRVADDGDFDAALLATGLLVAQCAVIWKLSPPAGVFDLRELFDRDGPPSFLVDARGRLRITWHGDAAEIVLAAADGAVNVSDALEGLDGSLVHVRIENLEPAS
jgi:hypothetical protein